ncbi:threonylcarbamoyl-AMP synthase [Sulfitobacter sp. TSTF-M16]|uniref:Threonylcarbamoyl-AMP synthase n=1 Tax=Sulfitobacter aestuariivivens TaxID=2766981 RepID=A0A927HGN3_9RHOB|nr:L-threonylcarbamoyladenylate synthase [Sulfitobacter aestuariivivens]MBD3664435.1 threonylcarbamoyl-AMP synthase [Sulfitobacter aestuariivivens]
MAQPSTKILRPDRAGVARAAQLLSTGALVAFPTETVYGLGANARDGKAVAKIYAAKGRPRFNPLIVHLPDAAMARDLVRWSDTAEILATAFWPGPLTLVLPLRADNGLSSLVTAGLDTVALRVPAHSTAQKMLHAFGGPVAAPSANPSGRISPTTATHVLSGLDGQIAAVLDDGPCTVGLESTIVGLTQKTPVLLRAGGLPREAIEAALGAPLDLHTRGAISAPGQLASHYAPRAQVRLNAQNPQDDEVFLGFGSMPADLNLSPSGDLTEAAANLFDHLHQLDGMRRPIAVAAIPQNGLGAAINDRLRRAAAPR